MKCSYIYIYIYRTCIRCVHLYIKEYIMVIYFMSCTVIRTISLLRLSLLRFVDSNFPGNWALARKGGMIRLEALVELKLLNWSFSSSNLSIRAFRAYPLIENRQAVPCLAMRGKSSDSRQQYLSQQYPPPPLTVPQLYGQSAG